jgi:hypothetical protein
LIGISFGVAKCHHRPEMLRQMKHERVLGSFMLNPKYLKYKGRGKTSAAT